jgi:predicted transcriptional regulator of viral defense system
MEHGMGFLPLPYRIWYGFAVSYRQQLRDLAFDTHGVVTTGDAERIGVPAVEVRKLAARGALTQVGRGVYRMLEAPSGRLSEYAEAVALAGTDAVLADESVLAALDLTHINLRRIRIASPRRVRVTLPPTIELVNRQIPAEHVADVEGIPAMTVAAAIRGARGRVMDRRLVEATRTAAARGLLSPSDEADLLAEMDAT